MTGTRLITVQLEVTAHGETEDEITQHAIAEAFDVCASADKCAFVKAETR